MPRSVKLRGDAIGKVQTIVNNTFYSQNDLADELGFAQSTISNFINGKQVDRRIFQDICEKLGIEDWRALAEVPQRVTVCSTQESSPTSAPIAAGPSVPTPMPATPQFQLENPEGSVPLHSPFYIERLPQEQYCREEITKPHALIRLKAPKQMGKTSIMMRLLHQSQQQGDRVVYLSLEQAMEQAWSHADRFLHWFCASVAIKTQHKFQQDEYTSLVAMVGNTLGTQEYFESYLLPSLAAPLAIGLDSIDRLFDYPHLYANFFSLLRSLHEEGKRNEGLSKLRLIVSYAAEVYVPLDINQSPFNVGISVEVSELTHDQVEQLAIQHQLNWQQKQIDHLMRLLGGHPFLVRLAMFEAVRNNIELTSLLNNIMSREGVFYKRHLARIETTLRGQPELFFALKGIFQSQSGTMLSPSTKGKLEGLGLIKLQGEKIVPRCELYHQYFNDLSL